MEWCCLVKKDCSTTKMSSQTRRNWKISLAKFCYICGELLVKLQARLFSENVKKTSCEKKIDSLRDIN